MPTDPTSNRADQPRGIGLFVLHLVFGAMGVFMAYETHRLVQTGETITLDGREVSHWSSVVFTSVLSLWGLAGFAGGVKLFICGNTYPFPDIRRLGSRRSQPTRGKCPTCGYSRVGLRDDMPCPECGQKIP